MWVLEYNLTHLRFPAKKHTNTIFTKTHLKHMGICLMIVILEFSSPRYFWMTGTNSLLFPTYMLHSTSYREYISMPNDYKFIWSEKLLERLLDTLRYTCQFQTQFLHNTGQKNVGSNNQSVAYMSYFRPRIFICIICLRPGTSLKDKHYGLWHHRNA